MRFWSLSSGINRGQSQEGLTSKERCGDEKWHWRFVHHAEGQREKKLTDSWYTWWQLTNYGCVCARMCVCVFVMAEDESGSKFSFWLQKHVSHFSEADGHAQTDRETESQTHTPSQQCFKVSAFQCMQVKGCGVLFKFNVQFELEHS